jgi:hypothetical protein
MLPYIQFAESLVKYLLKIKCVGKTEAWEGSPRCWKSHEGKEGAWRFSCDQKIMGEDRVPVPISCRAPAGKSVSGLGERIQCLR